MRRRTRAWDASSLAQHYPLGHRRLQPRSARGRAGARLPHAAGRIWGHPGASSRRSRQNSLVKSVNQRRLNQSLLKRKSRPLGGRLQRGSLTLSNDGSGSRPQRSGRCLLNPFTHSLLVYVCLRLFTFASAAGPVCKHPVFTNCLCLCLFTKQGGRGQRKPSVVARPELMKRLSERFPPSRKFDLPAFPCGVGGLCRRWGGGANI